MRTEATSDLATTLSVISTSLGTPVSLGGGTATLAGMLTKLADDAGGGDFDAGRHSQAAIRSAVGSDQYWADIDLSPNAADSTDLWTIVWHRNAALIPVASQSNVKLTVTKRLNGSKLIDGKTMTAVGTSGAFKYDASGSERVDFGEHYFAVVTATIDGAERTWGLIKER